MLIKILLKIKLFSYVRFYGRVSGIDLWLDEIELYKLKLLSNQLSSAICKGASIKEIYLIQELIDNI